MIRTIFTIALLLGLTGLAGFRENPDDRPLTVYAAASLSPLLEDISENRQAWNLPPLRLVTASSGALARQIAQGAPADLFITADRDWLDSIKTDHGAGRLFGNRLVLAGPCPAEPHAGLSDALAPPGRIATGDPAYVPLGRYTQTALEGAGLWTGLQDRFVRTSDARAALRMLETGAVRRAFLYESDSIQSDTACTLYRFPPAQSGGIFYWALPLSDHPVARDFIALIRSENFSGKVSQYGYVPLRETVQN